MPNPANECPIFEKILPPYQFHIIVHNITIIKTNVNGNIIRHLNYFGESCRKRGGRKGGIEPHNGSADPGLTRCCWAHGNTYDRHYGERQVYAMLLRKTNERVTIRPDAPELEAYVYVRRWQ